MIYIASKTVHAQKWRELRANGVPINSTWIDEAGQGESKDLADLWWRCIRESSDALCTIVYREEGEILKGAFIEVGSALASGMMVIAAGYWADNLSFLNHYNVRVVANMDEALRIAEGILNDSA